MGIVRICLVALCLLIVSFVCAIVAQGAEAIVDAPESVPPGQLFTLDSTDSVGDFKEWIIDDRLKNSVFICGERLASVTNKVGTYTIILVVSDSEGIDYKTTKVKVGSGDPPPVDPPIDPPVDPPTDPSNPDLTQLKKISTEEARKVNDSVTSSRLSSAIQSVSPQGTVSDTASLVQKTIEDTLLSREDAQRNSDWLPWRVAINLEIERLSPKTVSSYMKMLEAISISLP